MIPYLFWLVISPAAFSAETCHFQSWSWNVVEKRVEKRVTESKPRAALTKEEKGAVEGCTVCEEDQEELRIGGGVPPIRVCRKYAAAIRGALEKAKKEGFPLQSLVGYRVGRSRGKEDSRGLRTEFSNHSFGTAIDVNAELNGLYGRCAKFGPHCELRRGGSYRPGQPGAITRESSLYRALTAAGFRWGGELGGMQKDFMHFSLTGN